MLNINIFEHGNDDLEFDFYEAEVLTERVLKDVEEKFQVKLPKSYIDLMKIKNGGLLSYNYNAYYIEYTDPNDGEIYQEALNVPYLKGITLDEVGIGSTFETINEWEYPKDIIILLDEGHYCVCLDYRNYKGDNPPVSYIDLEVELDGNIAENFEKFVNNLTVEIDDENEDEEELETDFELEIFDKSEFEVLLKKDEDEIEIVDGIHYFLNSGENNEWFVKQLKEAINSKHIFVVEESIHALLSLIKKYKKIMFLHNVKKDIDSIANFVYENEDDDINVYSIRLKSYIENYI